MVNKLKRWRKAFFKELIKPENIAKEFVLGIFLLIMGYFLSFSFSNSLNPHPKLEIDCIDLKNNSLSEIRILNDGTIAAYNVEITAYSTSSCSIGRSLAQTNYGDGSEYFSNLKIGFSREYNSKYEIITGGKILPTGHSISFFCPKNQIFKINVGGENFKSEIKTCKT